MLAPWQPTAISIALLCSAGVCIALSCLVWRRPAAGARQFAWLALALGTWSLFSGLELAAVGQGTKVLLA